MKEIIEAHKEKVKKLGYSEEQAEEIIHRVSAMMSAFIDAAWGTHPAQLSQRANDKKSLASVKECVNIELPTNQSSHKSE